MDLIRTIEEDTEIQDLSEDSDAEVEVIWRRKNNICVLIVLDPCVQQRTIIIFSINRRNCDARKRKNLAIALNSFHR